MKKCYAHLERLPVNEIKKCSVKADLKNEIRVEEHDDLNDQIYHDDVSQSVFLLFEIINFGILGNYEKSPYPQNTQFGVIKCHISALSQHLLTIILRVELMIILHYIN